MKNPSYRLPFLDGIRGWGALSVLLYHVFIDGFPVSPALTKILAPIPLFNGTLAVWVFFIVSGFSLSIQYCRTQNRDVLVNIALGRYLRLAVPIFGVCILLFFCFRFGLIVEPANRPMRLQSVLVTAPDYLRIIKFSLYDVFFRYDPVQTLIPPLWTMPFELWGSCLVIGTLFVASRLRRRFIIYLLVSIIAYQLNTIYMAFLLGMVFAEIYICDARQKHLGKIGMLAALAIFPALVISWKLPTLSTTPFPVYLIASSLLCFGFIFNNNFSKLLSGKLSHFLGKISFPLYLVHAPIFYAFSAHLYQIAGSDPSDATKFLINIVTVVVAIFVAFLLIPVDQLGMTLSKKFSKYLCESRSKYRPGSSLASQHDPLASIALKSGVSPLDR